MENADQAKAVPGARWRILAHEGAEPVQVENRGILDEVVVDDWMHLEQMDERQWWMRVGDARIWVTIEDDGTARVDVERGRYEVASGATKTSPQGP